MRRMLAIAALAVVATLGLASTAGAQQYPPTGEGPNVAGAGANAGDDAAVQGAGANAGDGAGGDGSGAPLPRTGSDVVPLALVGAALLATGAFWVVTTRSKREVAP